VPAEIQKWIERTPLVHSLALLSSLLTLLCIDDDETSLQTRKAFLEDCGYKVLISTESGRAIRLFEENWVDLVILSSAMKSADEDVLARMLKRRNPKIPIVMISGSKEPSRSASMLVEHTVSIASGNAALLSAINQYLPRHQKPVTVPANDVGVAAQPQPVTRTKR
jgi:CheY-like chemotaxis protein